MTAHVPVMLHEMLDWLSPKARGTYIDGTFGAGGYSKAILTAANCRVFAIDRDPTTKQFAERLEHEFADRFVWLLGNFSDMCSLVATHGIHEVDGIVLDLGVSSMQIDNAARGFSFKKNGPLDMRMSAGQGMDAATVVNHASEAELADILYYYGEEKAARKIAHAIVQHRAQTPITSTRELAEIVRKVVGGRHKKTDPATKSFQALRIHVNHEFEEIENGLKSAETLLAPGGKLVVVAFHSLEDRLVKRFMSSRCGRLGEPSRHAPITTHDTAPHFFLPKPEKRLASAAESEDNPRARSAVLRMMVRADNDGR
jgi:16S rRNA (cytosine1402-N4)-methyltransferase